MFDAGELNDAQAFFWRAKPSEELYDLKNDPYQVRNLASDAEHTQTLERFRDAARDWMVTINDVGFLPEGEFLRRADGGAPYDLGHSADYSVAQLYQIADLASRPNAGDLDELSKYQSDPDAAVRFWVANGLLIRAMREQQVTETVNKARSMMGDPSSYVRCIACEVMARFGNEADRRVAMKSLVDIADPSNGSVFEAMTAMNSLDWCAPTQQEIGD
jgi:uncharacterized sulfatase